MIKVALRKKKISKGRQSLYLDFYPPISHPETGKPTRREFLNMYIMEKPKTATEIKENKAIISLAESIRASRFLEIQQGTYGFSDDSKKKESFVDFFADLVKQRYTTKSNYDNWTSAFKYFKGYYSDGLTMGEINERAIEDYRDYLEGLDLAQNTKHSYFSKLKAAIREAFRRRYLAENYAERIKGIKVEEVRREFVTLEEIQRLAKTECELPVLKQAFLFSAFTGLRFSDCQQLRWIDLQDMEDGSSLIRFRQKKTKGEQTLNLPNTARKILGERRKDNQLIFKNLKYSAWNNLKLRQWVKDAEINKDITFHCARHSFATLLMTEGADLYTVSKLLGHKNIQTTQIYAKIVDRLKIDAMNKLNDIDL